MPGHLLNSPKGLQPGEGKAQAIVDACLWGCRLRLCGGSLKRQAAIRVAVQDAVCIVQPALQLLSAAFPVCWWTVNFHIQNVGGNPNQLGVETVRPAEKPSILPLPLSDISHKCHSTKSVEKSAFVRAGRLQTSGVGWRSAGVQQLLGVASAVPILACTLLHTSTDGRGSRLQLARAPHWLPCSAVNQKTKLRIFRTCNAYLGSYTLKCSLPYLCQQLQQLEQEHPQPALDLLCLLIRRLQSAVCIVSRLIREHCHNLRIRPLRHNLHMSFLKGNRLHPDKNTPSIARMLRRWGSIPPAQKGRRCPLKMVAEFRSAATCCTAHQRLSAVFSPCLPSTICDHIFTYLDNDACRQKKTLD